MSFDSRPPAGTRVHVEFTGVVENDETQGHLATRPWQVVVTDCEKNQGGRLHVVNFEASTVTELPRRVELGQVYRADDRNFLVYHKSQASSYDDNFDFWFAGVTPGDANVVDITTNSAEFFKCHPDAELILDPSGELAYEDA